MIGAAWATLIAFVVQTVILVRVALGYYPIPYQWGRLAKVTAVAATLYAASQLVPSASLPVAVAAKSALLLTLPVVLWSVGFFEEAELARVRRARSGLRKRLALSRV
jgi:hypothetical protein